MKRIDTSPGAELMVVTYDAPCHIYGTRERRGVLVEMVTAFGQDVARIMRIDKSGDFSGIVSTILSSSITHTNAATIADDHSLVIGN